jgi:hypothetical protein
MRNINNKLLGLLFASVVFLSASLLFIIQPIFAKYSLFWFGGSSSIWITCLVFYQGIFALGYIYSYCLTKYLSINKQIALHSIMLIFCLITQAPVVEYYEGLSSSNLMWIKVIWALLILIGVPFFILSSSSPLIQSWMGLEPSFKNIYKMYAVSNLGSLLSLILYPFFIEPYTSKIYQFETWVYSLRLYIFLFLLINIILFIKSKKGLLSLKNKAKDLVKIKDIFWWTLLSALSVSVLISTTTIISKQIIPLPLLWIAPLVVYLLTFILSFIREIKYNNLFLLFHIGLCWAHYYTNTQMSYSYKIASSLLLLFSSCMICHSELYYKRPNISKLTIYYVWIAIGGFLGSFITTIGSTYIFKSFEEYETSLLIVFVVALISKSSYSQIKHFKKTLSLLYLISSAVLIYKIIDIGYNNQLIKWISLCTLISYIIYEVQKSIKDKNIYLLTKNTFFVLLYSLAIILISNKFNKSSYKTIYKHRNFYGAANIYLRGKKENNTLKYVVSHGGIIHGSQYLKQKTLATTYYGLETGVGKLLNISHPQKIKVGLIGLGIGTLASYAKKNDQYTFYEIDDDIIKLVENRSDLFTYVVDARKRGAKVNIIKGDARVVLEKQKKISSQEYDIIVLDAYLSDSMPIHLLTYEAFLLYQYHLKDDGVIAVHISNKYIDLKPVLMHHIEKLQLNYNYFSNKKTKTTFHSKWFLLSKKNLSSKDYFLSGGTKVPDIKPVKYFNDEHNTLLNLIKFKF